MPRSSRCLEQASEHPLAAALVRAAREQSLTLESAPLTLVRGDLRAIVEARALSRATIKAIRQNLLLAFAYNVLAIPLAAAGVLSPEWAAAAMSLSSISVIGNSLRFRA